jgi:hypothetical protein
LIIRYRIEKNKRPNNILSINPDIKNIIDRSSTVLVIATILLSVYGYIILPNIISIRFDDMGTAVGLRAKWVVFAFPIGAMLTYVTVQLLVSFVYSPDRVKYNIKLLALYEASASLMQLMRLSIILVIFLTLMLIVIGCFNYSNLFGLWYKILIGIILGLPVVWYLKVVTHM